MSKSSIQEFTCQYHGRSFLYWIFQLAVFAGLIWYIKTKVTVHGLAEELTYLDMSIFFSGLFIIIIMNLFRPYRSWILLRGMEINVRWWSLFRWHQEACFLSYFTPAKTGELYRAFCIFSKHKAIGEAMATSIIDRWIDMMIVLLLGISVIVLQPHKQVTGLRNLAAIILASIIICTIFFFNSNVRTIVKKLLALIPHKVLKEKCTNFLFSLSEAFKKIRLPVFFYFLLLSIITWVVYIFGFFILFNSLSVKLPLISFLSCVTIAMLVQAVPITFCGFGTREAALVLYLGNYGFSQPKAMSVSFLFISATIANMLVVFVFWLFRMKKRRSHITKD